MMRLVITLLTILLVKTTSFSQTISTRTEVDSTVLITASQLKETNLIFAEHYKLLQQNSLLSQQLKNYQYSNYILTKSDSLKSVQIQNYKSLSESLNNQINNLNDKLARKSSTITTLGIGGGVVVTLGILWLLLK